MHRHLAWAFSILCSSAALAACGDAGDHFLEFRCTASAHRRRRTRPGIRRAIRRARRRSQSCASRCPRFPTGKRRERTLSASWPTRPTARRSRRERSLPAARSSSPARTCNVTFNRAARSTERRCTSSERRSRNVRVHAAERHVQRADDHTTDGDELDREPTNRDGVVCRGSFRRDDQVEHDRRPPIRAATASIR